MVYETALEQMLSNTHPPTAKRIERVQRMLQ